MSRTRRRRWWIPVAAGGPLAVVLAGAEILHWRASRRLVGPGSGGPEIVLVLGYAARHPRRLHPLQRWRTQIAVRSMGPDPRTRLVFTGGARRGDRSEAETMAAYARDVLGVPAARIDLETRAVSTWDNVLCGLPLVESAGTLRVASDPMHAARCRAYLAEVRPDLLDRLAAADDYRFGERPWLKVPTALHELRRLARPSGRPTRPTAAAPPAMPAEGSTDDHRSR